MFARNEAEREQATRTLDESNPIEFEPAEQGARPDLGARPDVEAGRPAAGAETTREGEQVIPVVREELDVGKRAIERAYRVHAYVVEKPVEEQVHLRDERVIVERRPATGEQTLGSADAPREREFEVIERHEEPVVDKRARKTKDVVVRKEATERTENVRDTVKETKVDVNKDEANPADTPSRRPRSLRRRGDPLRRGGSVDLRGVPCDEDDARRANGRRQARDGGLMGSSPHPARRGKSDGGRRSGRRTGLVASVNELVVIF